MPINIKELKETEEMFLYVRRQSELRKRIIEFLKKIKIKLFYH